MIHKSTQHATGRVFCKHEALIIFDTLPLLLQDSIMIDHSGSELGTVSGEARVLTITLLLF